MSSSSLRRPAALARFFGALLGAWLLLEPCAREAHAATEQPILTRGAANLTATMGQARTPFPSPDAREISGLLTTFSVDTLVVLTPMLSASFRVPLVLADVYLPAGGARSTSSFGHPEATLLARLLQRGPLLITGGFGVAAPLGGDAALGRRPFENQALLLASAQLGWRDRELFAPGRLGLTPSVHVTYSDRRFSTFALLELPFLVAVKNGTPDERVAVRSVASTAALAAGVSAWWGDRLSFSAAPWLVANLLPTEEIRNSAGTAVNGTQGTTQWTLSLAAALEVRLTGPLKAQLGSTFLLAGAVHGLPSLALGLAATW